MKIYRNWTSSALLVAAVAGFPVYGEEKGEKPAAVATEEKPLTPELKSDSQKLEELIRRFDEQGRLINELTRKVEELTSVHEKAFLRNYKSAVSVKAHLTVVTQPNGTRVTGYMEHGSGTVVKTNVGTFILTNVHNLLHGITMQDFLKKPIQDQRNQLLSIAKNTETLIILPGGEEVKAKPLIIIKDGKEIPGLHAFRDVALLVPSDDITNKTKPVTFSLEKPKQGVPVIALGDAFGQQGASVLTNGVVSVVGDYHPFSMDKHEVSKSTNDDDYNSYVVCNVNIVPGNSGSPLVNEMNDYCYGMICQKVGLDGDGASLSRALASNEIIEFGLERGIKFFPYLGEEKDHHSKEVQTERTEKYNVIRI